MEGGFVADGELVESRRGGAVAFTPVDAALDGVTPPVVDRAVRAPAACQGLSTTSAVTRHPRPVRPVPRGRASGGGKQEGRLIFVWPEFHAYGAT
jgi:peptidoglycan hydrolase-like protein with peptidoglycan-binding domain